MKIKQFIEKAVEEGYGWKKWDVGGWGNLEKSPHLEAVLLDPKAWEAVGKVEGWHDKELWHWSWQNQMHAMIDALAEGKTLEEFIKTL